MNSAILSLSSGVNSTFKALLIEPLSACSQQDRLLCRYAPRPSALPDGSMRIPLGVFTMRINSLFERTLRHPIQVRCGTCLIRFCAFLATSPSRFLFLKIPFRAATFVFLGHHGEITIWIVGYHNVFALLFLLLVLIAILGFFIL